MNQILGKLADLSIGMDGKQKLTITLLNADFREAFDALKDKVLSIVLKESRKHRSLDANSYAWVLIDQIAEATHVSKSEVYKNAIRDIGGVSTIIGISDIALETFQRNWESKGLGWQTEVLPSRKPGWNNVVVYYGSSCYDTKQMSTLIDHLIQDAEGLGIPTITPQELARLKER